MIQDLRDWLWRVDQLGELVCISEPVDPIEEMGAVTYLVAKQSPSPAVLFEPPAASA
jgi:3-polyprenyl-4-hydroxybenzoate decarboxylase